MLYRIAKWLLRGQESHRIVLFDPVVGKWNDPDAIRGVVVFYHGEDCDYGPLVMRLSEGMVSVRSITSH